MIESMDFPRVSVVILNYNGKQFVEPCLTSVLATDYPDFEVMLVDNASSDGSADLVAARFGKDPRLRLLTNDRNLGFVGGNNEGARCAKGELIIFLNNDTVVDSSWMKELVKVVLSDKSVGIAICRILSIDGTDPQVVGNVDKFGNGVLMKVGASDDVIETIASGPAFLVTRDAWSDVHGFDPKYFAYVEDLDLAWRVKLSGRKAVTALRSVVYHEGGGTTGRIGLPTKRYLVYRNTTRTLVKNYSFSSLLQILPRSLAFSFLQASAMTFLMRDPRISLSLLRALSWNLKNFKDTWDIHLRIQTDRVLSDNEVQELMVRSNPILGWFGRLRETLDDNSPRKREMSRVP